MAKIQNTKFDRYKRHFIKKVYCTCHGLRMSAVKGRFSGPKVLINSIPKAGTHLLEKALEQFPLLRNSGKKTLTCWDEPDNSTLRTLRHIKKGQFLNSHLTAHDQIFETLEENAISTLFVIRDPRDIAVSRFKYITEIDRTHWASEFFRKLPNDNERLLASIKGVEGFSPSIGEVLRRFEPWLHMNNALVCRFEDLIGPKGGGSFENQINALKDISIYINISLKEKELTKIAENSFSGKSSTYRKGKAFDWRNYFDQKHIEVFKKVANAELISYGYENSEDW